MLRLLRKDEITMTKTEAIEAKKAKMKQLAEQFAKMSESERVELSNQLGSLRTIEGRPLSFKNSALLYFQKKGVSIVGGFQQWKKAGRIVRKGEKALAIFCPASRKTKEGETTDSPSFFFTGSVFDISQTEPLTPSETLTRSLVGSV
jgi:hypothetical protein